ncbi:LLM class flavin-dependent oxidoreductase [Mesorhizobium sp. L-8-10]|uniref:LLM class flavin-dependent oxidoreductase n=1 Tax=Mesorhizobium sp. L-8-10 TaxID=2744523 RepID=UPI001928C630|nr:LLM class flavin-dependent oxidoreductase [Mesorhizobium sp. L-8-10]
MILGVFLGLFGGHPAAWRHPDAPSAKAYTDLSLYVEFARQLEAEKLDLLFLADVPAIREGNMDALRRFSAYMMQLEPLTLLSGIAASTSRIGLAATMSTSFSEPYNLARQFASLDHLSNGRSAWNLVTTSSSAASLNFGSKTQVPHADRYRQAREFAHVVCRLWDGWDADAVVGDREQGILFDPSKIRRAEHAGEFYNVRGPLNIPRPPQDRPLIIQAGGSEAGKDLAAEISDIVFSAEPNKERASAFYRDLKGRLARFGRNPSDLKILYQLTPIVCQSKHEAEDRRLRLESLLHISVAREILSFDLGGVDLSDLPDDEPIPAHRIPSDTAGGKTYLEIIRSISSGATLQDVAHRYAASRGGLTLVGQAEEIADEMEAWISSESADGFMIGFSSVPDDWPAFRDMLLPELRRRGLVKSEYTGRTLREHLGLTEVAAIKSGSALWTN